MKKRIALIKKSPYNIKHIYNPHVQLQLQAVKQSGCAIMHIPFPCLKVQLQAIKQDVNSIRYITDPHLEVQLVVVRKMPAILGWFNSASYEVQLVAVQTNIWTSLQWVTDIQVLQNIDCLQYDSNGKTLLFYTNHRDIIHFLLNKGVDPYHLDNYGMTAMIWIKNVDGVLLKRQACKKLVIWLKKCKWYRLDKLVRSKIFCEWYYDPRNMGGILAKMKLSLLVTRSIKVN
jgi:hypothetical protein